MQLGLSARTAWGTTLTADLTVRYPGARCTHGCRTEPRSQTWSGTAGSPLAGSPDARYGQNGGLYPVQPETSLVGSTGGPAVPAGRGLPQSRPPGRVAQAVRCPVCGLVSTLRRLVRLASAEPGELSVGLGTSDGRGFSWTFLPMPDPVRDLLLQILRRQVIRLGCGTAPPPLKAEVPPPPAPPPLPPRAAGKRRRGPHPYAGPKGRPAELGPARFRRLSADEIAALEAAERLTGRKKRGRKKHPADTGH